MIRMCGKVYDQTCFDQSVNRWFDVVLLVMEDGTIAFEMLLGRNFFLTSKIKLIYQSGEFIFEYPPREEMALDFICAIELESEDEQYDDISMDEELGYETRRRVSNLFREIDELQIEPVRDDHKI